MDVVDGSLDRARLAAKLIFEAATNVNVGWLVAGMGLHLLSQAVRLRGWWNILRFAYPTCSTLSASDVTRAYFAGAGLNGLLPARAGDVVKLAVLRRRIPGSHYATLLATSVPETAFETLCGLGLVVWMLGLGFLPVPTVRGELPSPDVSVCLRHPGLALLAAGAVFGAGLGIALRLRRRSAALGGRLRQGLAIFGAPRRYVTYVVSWQAAGRLVRLCSLACLLAAFALPVSLGTALLVMAAQGGGRIVPVAPVAAGMRIALLSYGLVEISGRAIDPAAVMAFTFGVSAVQFLLGLSISLALLSSEFGTRSPRAALRSARARLTRDGRPALDGHVAPELRYGTIMSCRPASSIATRGRRGRRSAGSSIRRQTLVAIREAVRPRHRAAGFEAIDAPPQERFLQRVIGVVQRPQQPVAMRGARPADATRSARRTRAHHGARQRQVLHRRAWAGPRPRPTYAGNRRRAAKLGPRRRREGPRTPPSDTNHTPPPREDLRKCSGPTHTMVPAQLNGVARPQRRGPWIGI